MQARDRGAEAGRKPVPGLPRMPLRQRVLPSPTRRLVRMRDGPAVQVLPDAAPAWGCAQPAGKSVRHITARVLKESQAGFRDERASLAGSTNSIVPKAARSDRFALRSAAVRPQVSFWESHRSPKCRNVPVAAARNPTNQIVPVGRGKWQDLYELDAGFTRKSHQHEIR